MTSKEFKELLTRRKVPVVSVRTNPARRTVRAFLFRSRHGGNILEHFPGSDVLRVINTDDGSERVVCTVHTDNL